MPEEIIRRKRRLSSFQIIILGFAGVILLGALLLMLPISTTGGNVTPFNETLFTATSAVCVTGLVVQDTGSYWSTFGQAVIQMCIRDSLHIKRGKAATKCLCHFPCHSYNAFIGRRRGQAHKNMPVSYTHLDVYKRQLRFRSLLRGSVRKTGRERNRIGN